MLQREWALHDSTSTIGRYTLVTTFDGGEHLQGLRILDHDRVAYQLKEDEVMGGPVLTLEEPVRWLESAEDMVKNSSRDITGDGIPELFFEIYSGGAHCCSNVKVISMTAPIRDLMYRTDADRSPELIDVDNDDLPEIRLGEQVFDEWHGPSVVAAKVAVILKWDAGAGRFRVSPSLMRTAPMKDVGESTTTGWTAENWDGREWRSFHSDGLTHIVTPWVHAVDLIYRGRSAEAVQYIEKVWANNNEFASKQAFWGDVKQSIRSSPHYGDMVATGLIDLAQLP